MTESLLAGCFFFSSVTYPTTSSVYIFSEITSFIGVPNLSLHLATCTVTSKLCQPLAISPRLLSRSTATNVVLVERISLGPPTPALVTTPVKFDVCFVSNLTSKCFVHWTFYYQSLSGTTSWVRRNWRKGGGTTRWWNLLKEEGWENRSLK